MDNKSSVNKLNSIFLKKFLLDDGKIFFIVFFVLFLLLVSGIVTEQYINKVKINWEKIIVEESLTIQSIVEAELKFQENLLLRTLKKLKTNINLELNKSDEIFKIFIKELNKNQYNDFSVEVYTPNGKLFAWNTGYKSPDNNLFPLTETIGETFFLEKELFVFLSVIDTFYIQQDEFYIFISLPIEKKYELNNKYYNELSIINTILKKIKTDIKIDFNPFTSPLLDSKKYSFELLNNKNKKIGLATIDKPTIENKLNKIKGYSTYFQSILILFGFGIIGIGLRRDYKNIKSKFLRFLFFLIYIVLIRIILFAFSLPSKFISGPLVDPTNFSSTFGFGIIKSPLELLITVIFISVLSLQFFRYCQSIIIEDKILSYKSIKIIIIASIAVIFPLILRAFASSIQSVVFDSKIRYFKDFTILPDLSSLVMHINILLIGVSFIIVLVGLSLILRKILFNNLNEFKLKEFLIIIFIISISSLSFYFISKNPLYNIINLIIILISIFWIFNLFIKRKNTITSYIIILFVSSFNSVILLNYFDTLKERESVKNIPLEINRLNKQLLKFYLTENINKIFSEQTGDKTLLRRDINFSALAFLNWTKSSFHREELNSFISIYDRNGKLSGGFKIGIEFDENIKPVLGKFNDTIVFDYSNIDSLKKKIILKSKYLEQEVPQLVVSTGVKFEVNKLGGVGFPEFLKSDLNIINQYINIEKVKIFQFLNNNLVQFYGDLYPNREQIKHIFSVKLDSIFNDGWTNIKFGKEKYEVYILKTNENENEITTVVAITENRFSWSLFNFFKVFIIHSIMIFIYIIIISVRKIKNPLKFFKYKLLLLFLIISILPITFLGIYYRNSLNESSILNIQNQLKQKSLLVENNFVSSLGKNTELIQIANNTSQMLNISFNIFKGSDLIYSTEKQFFDINILSKKLNSQVYYLFNYEKFRELFITEKVENYFYQSYYKVLDINNKQFILNLNEAFNKSDNMISFSEFDVVLFGLYSLTLVIIIISSTLLANQISLPIHRLTKATEAIGKGDLNVKIIHKEKGEIKELLNGFNKMTEQLRKSQLELAEFERESAWKEMAKQVAHEIKNPLTPMKLTLQHLIASFKEKREDFDKLFEKLSFTVLNQIDNLNQIASEFSRFAKMPNLNLEKFNLLILLNELSNIYLNEKIKINVVADSDSYFIENDKNQLNRVFINLIRNSIQASANNLNITIISKKEFLEIYVEDNGIGIRKEYQDKIFNKNFSTKKIGMGLGLKIAKKFLNDINGDILLVTSSEKGTIFKILLPYAKK